MAGGQSSSDTDHARGAPNIARPQSWLGGFKRFDSAARAHLVTAVTVSVWRLLSWRRSIFMRPTPKQYTLRSRSSSRPAPCTHPTWHECPHQAILMPSQQVPNDKCQEGSKLPTAPALRATVKRIRDSGCLELTLGYTARATIPQRPVAGQQGLRKGFRGLIPRRPMCQGHTLPHSQQTCCLSLIDSLAAAG